jgi:hypothetical protein
MPIQGSGLMRRLLIFAAVGFPLVLGAVFLVPKPTSKFDDVVRVNVFLDHYDIGGHRFSGSLMEQLGKYGGKHERVLITLIGSDSDVTARLNEIGKLKGNGNIKIETITFRRVL